jgi:hypothetical protein
LRFALERALRAFGRCAALGDYGPLRGWGVWTAARLFLQAAARLFIHASRIGRCAAFFGTRSFTEGARSYTEFLVIHFYRCARSLALTFGLVATTETVYGEIHH